MHLRPDPLYVSMRALIRLALGFYFRRVERFRAERVPDSGPVLFTSNHPNSLADSFVIGASVPRKVNFVATVQLFRFAALKWFLTRCGVIPINRVRDDPRAMRSVAETFEACYRVLAKGEAVGIFPEGITYEDSQLKEVKTGAARMALEFEDRHSGKSGLRVVPVGLTYSAKERYRSDVLVHFGEPICASDYLNEYSTQKKECIRKLTAEIDHRLRSLIVDVAALDQGRVVDGVKQLFLDRLMTSGAPLPGPISSAAGKLLRTQAISEAVKHVFQAQPDRAANFARKLAGYQRWLDRFRISDASLNGRDKALTGGAISGAMVLLGLPVALYGWIHRLLPYAIVRYVQARFVEPGKKKAQAATAAIVAGVVAFGFFYPAYVFVFHSFYGWPASFWYALTLPVASLLAHYYVTRFDKLWQALRNLVLFTRAPALSRHLIRTRTELIAEIEAVHQELQQEQASKSASGKPVV